MGVKYELNENHLTITGPEDCKGCKLGQISRSEYFRDKIRTVELKGNITSIGEYAFFGCKNLLSIEIPGSATEIGENAFLFCKSLKSVEMPSVETIEKHAFTNCRSLLRIDLSSAKEIQDYAFRDCSSLMEINPPNKEKLKHIGNGVFAKCSSLHVKCIQAMGLYGELIKDEEYL